MGMHFHSTLSDEGIEDDDMRSMESPKSKQGDYWLNATSENPSSVWDFGVEDIPLDEFSSAQQNDEQLPETVPLPSQLELIRNTAVKSADKPDHLDLSETCSTNNRSTPPCNNEDLDQQFNFPNEQSDLPLFAASETAEKPAGLRVEQPAELSNDAPAPARSNSKQAQKKPYNTRSRPKISYVDGESSSDDDDEPDGDASPKPAPRGAVLNPKRNASPARDKFPKLTKKRSAKNRMEDEQAESGPQTAERRKKRQRRKTPLPMDEVTLIVPSTLPATPPVSTERPKKRQRRQPRETPAKLKPKTRAANTMPKNVSPVPIQVTTSPELGSSQPAEVIFDASFEDLYPQNHSPAPAETVVPYDEEQDESSGAGSTHSTGMTTPSTVPSPRRISSTQVPVLSHPPIPRPPSTPFIYDEVQDSVESITATRPPLMRDLSTLVPKIVSRRDEDIGHRLQDIHKRVVSYLQDKEKDVASVASTYLKNGARCVDRLHNRFAKERQVLLQRLYEDRDTFSKSLSTAKRGLREAAKDRQRVLKELDRNAKKRQQGCSNEVNRIKDIAKRVQAGG